MLGTASLLHAVVKREPVVGNENEFLDKGEYVYSSSRLSGGMDTD